MIFLRHYQPENQYSYASEHSRAIYITYQRKLLFHSKGFQLVGCLVLTAMGASYYNKTDRNCNPRFPGNHE